jgi:hypothetical protein
LKDSLNRTKKWNIEPKSQSKEIIILDECYGDRLVHYLFHMTRRTYTSLYFYNISQDGHLHLFFLIYIQLNETRISNLIF